MNKITLRAFEFLHHAITTKLAYMSMINNKEYASIAKRVRECNKWTHIKKYILPQRQLKCHKNAECIQLHDRSGDLLFIQHDQQTKFANNSR